MARYTPKQNLKKRIERNLGSAEPGDLDLERISKRELKVSSASLFSITAYPHQNLKKRIERLEDAFLDQVPNARISKRELKE